MAAAQSDVHVVLTFIPQLQSVRRSDFTSEPANTDGVSQPSIGLDGVRAGGEGANVTTAERPAEDSEAMRIDLEQYDARMGQSEPKFVFKLGAAAYDMRVGTRVRRKPPNAERPNNTKVVRTPKGHLSGTPGGQVSKKKGGTVRPAGWLPAGWKVTLRAHLSGESAGKMYKVYHSPEGKIYNSYAASKPHFEGPLIPQPTAKGGAPKKAGKAAKKGKVVTPAKAAAAAAQQSKAQRKSGEKLRKKGGKWTAPIAVPYLPPGWVRRKEIGVGSLAHPHEIFVGPGDLRCGSWEAVLNHLGPSCGLCSAIAAGSLPGTTQPESAPASSQMLTWLRQSARQAGHNPAQALDGVAASDAAIQAALLRLRMVRCNRLCRAPAAAPSTKG